MVPLRQTKPHAIVGTGTGNKTMRATVGTGTVKKTSRGYGIAAAGTGNKIMRATVCRVPGTRKYTVWIVQGVQSFQLDYKATKGECNSMAEMFERALDASEAKAVRRLIPLEDTILPSSVYNDRLLDAGTSRAAMRSSAAALKRLFAAVTTCTRPKPHTCRVNGPCNGWPREVPSVSEYGGEAPSIENKGLGSGLVAG